MSYYQSIRGNWISGVKLCECGCGEQTIGNRCFINGHNQCGKKRSEKTKQKISEAKSGKKLSENIKKHMSEAARIRWKKWHLEHSKRSKEHYDENYTEEFRELIKRRDNYSCRICGKTEVDQILKSYLNGKRPHKLSIHHIDYNKKNSIDQNCISLCSFCHSKTNTNRIYWQKLFTEGMGSSRSHGIIGG